MSSTRRVLLAGPRRYDHSNTCVQRTTKRTLSVAVHCFYDSAFMICACSFLGIVFVAKVQEQQRTPYDPSSAIHILASHQYLFCDPSLACFIMESLPNSHA